MALSSETTAWLEGLKKDGGLSDEAYNTIRASLDSPKADEYVKGSSLRQADYSKKMDELRASQVAATEAQNQLAISQSNVAKYQIDVANWKTGAEAKYKQTVSQAEALERRATAAVARVRALAIANGIDETEALKDIDIVPTTEVTMTNKTNQVDMSQYLTQDQFQENVKKAVAESATIEAAIYDVASEHRRLFGQDLPNARELVQGAMAAKQTLSQFWESKFKVPEKRAEAAETAFNERVNKAVEEKTSKFLSEQALSQSGQHMAPNNILSPVFRPDVLKPIASDHQAGAGISAAIAAATSGKYRPK